MSTEEIRDYCLSFKAVTESFPFDEDTLVFKVMGKMFALMSLEERTVNLKCDPEKAVALREQYNEVTPGYHMNKKYWNTVQLQGMIPDKLMREWIRESYERVVEGVRKSDCR